MSGRTNRAPAPAAPRSDLGTYFRIVVGVELLFVAIFVFNTFVPHSVDTLRQFFDLDAEATIPGWFSSIQLFAVGATLLLGLFLRRAEDVPARRVLTWIALGFMFLSADESAGIHEQITKVFGDIDALPNFRHGHGVWIPIYLTAGALFALLTMRSLVGVYRYQPRAVRTILGGLAIFVVGVVVLEVVSYQLLRDVGREVAYHLEVAVEEFAEMLGVTIVWLGVVRLFDLDTPFSGTRMDA